MTEVSHAGRVLMVGAPTSHLSQVTSRLRRFGLDVVPIQSLDAVVSDLMRRPAAVVVLDSSLDARARLDVLDDVRRDSRLSEVRILWLARVEDGDTSARALERGADDILTHPFEIGALRLGIEELLSQVAVLRHADKEASLLARLAEIEDALDRSDHERASLSERIASHIKGAGLPTSTLTSDDPTPFPAPEPRLSDRGQRALSSNAYKRTAELSMLDVSIVREVDALIDEAGPNPLRLSILVVEPDGLDGVLAQLKVDDASSVLRQLGAALSPLVRDHDIVRELGRRQLCILLPHTDEGPAIEVARRLREHTATNELRVFGQAIRLTVSIGIATLDGPSDASPFDLIEWAATAAVHARELGGDRWWIDTWDDRPDE